MRSYDMGNPELDAAIAELVERASDERQLGSDRRDHHHGAEAPPRLPPTEGNSNWSTPPSRKCAIRCWCSAVIASRPKVTMYGSARTPEDDPEYLLAMEFARIMAEERDWDVLTGAGPGVMEAGNKGAGLDASFGVNIRLPFEGDANAHISPDKLINFKYFFTRKLGFVKESQCIRSVPWRFRDHGRGIRTPHSHPNREIRYASDRDDPTGGLRLLGRVGSLRHRTTRRARDDLARGSRSVLRSRRILTRRPTRSAASTPTTSPSATWTGSWSSVSTRRPTPEQVAALNEEFSDIVAKATSQ